MTNLRQIIPLVIAALCAFSEFASAVGVTYARAERTTPGVYRIDLSVTADAWPVAIYPSARPDSIDPGTPATVARMGTVYVTVPGRQRVYFHLRPAAGHSRVVALRHIPLEGATNLRDLGGYATTDGRYVRWGLLYRSDHLGRLTAADYATLNTLGIRLICDLRTADERQREPTRWTGGASPEVLTTPGAPSSNGAVPLGSTPVAAHERLTDETLGRRMQEIEAGRAVPEFDVMYPVLTARQIPIYKALFARLVAGDLPTLTHCTAGQDRTGIFAAILLLSLGVPKDTVMDDYLLTNRYRRPEDYIDHVRRTIQRRLKLVEPPSYETTRWMEDIHPSNLNSALAAIDREWGSFRVYLEKALELSPSGLDRLRALVLEH